MERVLLKFSLECTQICCCSICELLKDTSGDLHYQNYSLLISFKSGKISQPLYYSNQIFAQIIKYFLHISTELPCLSGYIKKKDFAFMVRNLHLEFVN